MEYQEFVTTTNSLIVAGELIASLQKGDQDKEWLLHSVMNRTYTLSDGREGDILCLAIELQKYIAALQLIEYNTYSSEEDIKTSLMKSLEYFKGEEDLERLKEKAGNDSTYERMIIERTANIKALEALKSKYLGMERVRQ